MKRQGFSRRQWLRFTASLGLGGVSGYLAQALAAGDLPPGLHKVEGSATVNGKAAPSGTPVNLGDKIATGAGSQAVVVLKGDAFLMRANTVIEVRGAENRLSELIITTGRLLSVFSKKNVSIKAATATIGIRGTGAYVEVAEKEVYLCLCYGEALVQGPNMPDKTVITKHHEQPLLLTESAGALRAEPGPFRNHTDAELVMLEQLVGREPPFMKGGQYPQNKY